MAISNRDRVGRMFELLAPPLDEFISRSVASRLNQGASWTVLVQLKVLTENIPHNLKAGWYPFDDAIGRVGQGYCKELREARNDWAHNESFSDDDAYRCLDTAERLLVAIGAPSVATSSRSAVSRQR